MYAISDFSKQACAIFFAFLLSVTYAPAIGAQNYDSCFAEAEQTPASIPAVNSEISEITGAPDDTLSAGTGATGRVARPAEAWPTTPQMAWQPEKTFKAIQLIAPAALITVGSVGVCNGAFKKLKRKIRSGMANLRNGHYFHGDDYLQYLPALTYFGLAFTRVSPRHSLLQRMLVESTAYASMAVIVNGVKYTVGERRPDSSAHNSFPSGHTATAFTGAEIIREEYGTWWGVGAYTFATGIAFLRLYNERHWLNDVIAGAGIGILSARIGYWLLPVYNRLFHWDLHPRRARVTAMPSYNAGDRSVGFSMAMVF